MYPYAGQENINSNYLSLHFSEEYYHIHWSDFCDVIAIETKKQQQQQPKMQSRGTENVWLKVSRLSIQTNQIHSKFLKFFAFACWNLLKF